MTITLAVGVQLMAKRNAIIRNLPSIESLGAVSVKGAPEALLNMAIANTSHCASGNGR